MSISDDVRLLTEQKRYRELQNIFATSAESLVSVIDALLKDRRELVVEALRALDRCSQCWTCGPARCPECLDALNRIGRIERGAGMTAATTLAGVRP